MATSGDIKSVRFRAIGTYPGEDFRLGLFVHSLSLARGSEAKDEVEFGLDMPRHARTASSDDVFVSGHPAEVAASKHIDSRVVSRSHARLFWSKLYHTRRLALKIVDLKSTHGTILRSRSGEKNIQLVPFLEHELEHGDILILGRRVEKGSETYEPPAFEVSEESAFILFGEPLPLTTFGFSPIKDCIRIRRRDGGTPHKSRRTSASTQRFSTRKDELTGQCRRPLGGR